LDFSFAIENKLLVHFSYGGHPRIVVPAAYGLHASTHNPVLRGYQVGGTSSSRLVPLWDLFLLDRISDFAVSEEHFEDLPPLYKRDDKDISPIYAQL
jgi:hypothetical protein